MLEKLGCNSLLAFTKDLALLGIDYMLQNRSTTNQIESHLESSHFPRLRVYTYSHDNTEKSQTLSRTSNQSASKKR